MSDYLISRYRIAMQLMGRDAGEDIPDDVLAERLEDVAYGAGITLKQLVETIEARVGRVLEDT